MINPLLTKQFSKYKPPGGIYLEGRYWFGGLIFGEAYTWRGLFSEFYGIYNHLIIYLFSGDFQK